ncbi:hypothetical protein BIFDEN_01128 [Bifidobacterium dentium ATCC 27678]|nr:hypothetical protein BIFDEN_01128 [Bifidobacterium dentium ATCC 27678]
MHACCPGVIRTCGCPFRRTGYVMAYRKALLPMLQASCMRRAWTVRGPCA